MCSPFDYHFYHPQRSWGKVILSEACVHILSTGGRVVAPGGACMPGECVAKGGMLGEGRGVHGEGGMHGKGGIHGEGWACVARGHAW